MCGCLLHTPYWGRGPQPRHVPWLGIKLATLWPAGWHSIHWATPARATKLSFFFSFKKYIYTEILLFVLFEWGLSNVLYNEIIVIGDAKLFSLVALFGHSKKWLSRGSSCCHWMSMSENSRASPTLVLRSRNEAHSREVICPRSQS